MPSLELVGRAINPDAWTPCNAIGTSITSRIIAAKIPSQSGARNFVVGFACLGEHFAIWYKETKDKNWFPQHMPGASFVFVVTLPVLTFFISAVSSLSCYIFCVFTDAKDSAGRAAAPLELLVLGVLRVLGRHFTFDDIAEATRLSESTCRVFFHEFCRHWSEEKYPELVKMPQTAAECASHEHEYKKAGFTGCIGSIDCVHVAWWQTPVTLKNACKGKEGYVGSSCITCMSCRRLF